MSEEKVEKIGTSARREFDKRINQFGYHYICPLGRGASGFVIRARPLSKTDDSDEDVAIKIIPMANIVKSEERRKKLRREITIHRLLDHPNLIKLYEAYKDKSYVYIVMEFARGKDLFEKINSSTGAFTEEEIFEDFQQVASGLEYLHDKCISHRDLKLENILVCGKTLKICDFGLSILLGPTELARSFVGSREYVSPEILEYKGEKYYDGYKVDIFSLGVVLYCLSFGVFPFEGDKRNPNHEVLHFLDTLQRDRELKDLIKKMMHKDPKKRIGLDEIRNHNWWKKMELKTGKKPKLKKMKKKKKKKREKLEEFKERKTKKKVEEERIVEKKEEVEEEEEEEEDEGEEDEIPLEKKLESGVGKKIKSFFQEIGIFLGKKMGGTISSEEEMEHVYYKLMKKKIEKGENVKPVSLKFDD